MRSSSRYRRRGSMYVAVIGAVMVVTVIGLSALLAVRIEHRATEGGGDFAQARLHAQSAIEIGLHRIANGSDWRTTFPNGIWEKDQPVGTGMYTLEGTDPDGKALDENYTDPLVLTGIGMQGDARYKLAVTLVHDQDPLTCLEAAWHANNDIRIESSTVINGDQVISANDMITATGTVTVHPDMEAGTGFSGTLGPGSQSILAPLRTVPDTSTVFDWYVTNGTQIDLASLPSLAGMSLIEDVLISPANNPYGPTNAQGIYVIDCMGQVIKILNSRIVGTLVLLDPSAASMVQNSVNWEAAVVNYPAMMVRGSFRFGHDSVTPLSEASLNVNFNPIGTPYEGQDDAVLDDTYPTIIKGLVYVSVDVTTSASPAFEGVVVSGNTTTQVSQTTLTYDPSYLSNPPPGFSASTRMVVSPGTWRQVVD